MNSYIVKQGEQVPLEEPITWRFSQNGYQKRSDDSLFCDFDGTYELENGVRLNETNPRSTVKTCNEDLNPTGFFQLDQSTDTVKMTQYNSQEDVLKTIKLLKTE